MSDRLNLGCGRKHIDSALNVDSNPASAPDLLHDLNSIPWPLPADHFSEVFACDIIEHCDDIIATMQEIHRVCRDRAVVRITVPHFSCVNAYADPTHRHLFASSSFNYVTGEHELSYYTAVRFRRRLTQIVFFPTFFNKFIGRFAKRWPERYERRWAWMFPAWFIYFELEVVKS
jgi:SAM-dependent methyltransferase